MILHAGGKRKWGWVKAPEPQRSFYGFVSYRDYPSVAFIKNQTGRVRTLLRIDATGTVANCEVIESSGVPLLDKRTCDIFSKRAKFSPALNVDGKPVPSS